MTRSLTTGPWIISATVNTTTARVTLAIAAVRGTPLASQNRANETAQTAPLSCSTRTGLRRPTAAERGVWPMAEAIVLTAKSAPASQTGRCRARRTNTASRTSSETEQSTNSTFVAVRSMNGRSVSAAR
jgi:hypothetical protein